MSYIGGGFDGVSFKNIQQTFTNDRQVADDLKGSSHNLSVTKLMCFGLLFCYGSSCTKAKAFYELVHHGLDETVSIDETE